MAYNVGLGYDINPAPSTYDPTFGGIPGPVGLPDPFAGLTRAGVNLGQLNPAASADLSAQFGGQVSPGTQQMLQNLDAAQGVRSGMPGSNLFRNKTLRDLGLTSEQQVNNAFRNYSSFVPTVSGTQTVSPALQTQIAQRNATINAAPNPSKANSYAQQLFDQYLQAMKGPAAGTGGATSPSSGFGFGQFPSGVGTPDQAPTYGTQSGTSPVTTGSSDPSNPSYWDFTNPSNLADVFGTASPAGDLTDPFADITF